LTTEHEFDESLEDYAKSFFEPEWIPLRSPAEWAILRRRLFDGRSKEQNFRPLRRLLALARHHGATSVLIEPYYFCRDFRSTLGLTYVFQTWTPPSFCDRVHFFLDCPPVWWDATQYLGYVVLRPVELEPVMRAMMPPPNCLVEWVRTAVTHDIHLFGKLFSVTAVPFAQQDGQATVCAHSCIWMIAFSNFLKYRSMKRPTMADVILSTRTSSASKLIAGVGINHHNVGHTFELLGLDAEVVTAQLPVTDYPWDASVGDDSQKFDRKTGEYMCRYLNSSLPVYLQIGSHSLVVCGYSRHDNRAERVGYVVHDDEVGPYKKVYPSGWGAKAWNFAVAARPEGVLLTPLEAELEALDRFDRLVPPSSSDIRLKMESRELRRKTTLLRANELKKSWAERADATLAVSMSIVPMSEFVYSVELVDEQGKSHMECVLDASTAGPRPLVHLTRVQGEVRRSLPGSFDGLTTTTLSEQTTMDSLEKWMHTTNELSLAVA
jgi:hypothetical protein